jgi:hypothetical protein
VSDVTLHLAMRDARAAAVGRAARAQVRAAQPRLTEKQAKAELFAIPNKFRTAAAAKSPRWGRMTWVERLAIVKNYIPEAEAEQAREAAEACKVRIRLLLCAGATTTLLVLLISYFSSGCGACENEAACDGLIGECVCTGNHAGEYCEHSCGEFGRVSGSACELDGKVGNMIMRSDHNDATVQAVTYTGLNTALSWQLQHELCNAAGKATPGSNGHAGDNWGYRLKWCSYSPSDNYVVTDTCSWEEQNFTYVSGSLGGGVGYMCANRGCNHRVRVEGMKTSAESFYEPTTLRDGDAVFCSSCLLDDDEPCAETTNADGISVVRVIVIAGFVGWIAVFPGLVMLLHLADAVCERCCGRNFLPFDGKAAPRILLVVAVVSVGIAVYIELPKQPDGDERLASLLTNV